jgi:hypothetical protein
MLGPIAFVMLGGACFIGYKLNSERHGEIRRELEARDAALYDEAPVLATITREPGDVAPPETQEPIVTGASEARRSRDVPAAE